MGTHIGSPGVVVTTRRRWSLARQEAIFGYLFLLPWIIGLVVFIVLPMLATVFLSLTTYSIVKPPVFTGLDNFIRAFTQDVLFWPSMGRTFQWAILFVPLAIGGAMMTAVLLNQGLTFTNIYRTIFFLPHLTPIVASMYIWTWLLQPQFGFVNELLWQVFQVQGPGWFASKDWAMPSLILVALWGAIGGNMMLIFLAGLQGVPKELYEVAAIDGANLWQRFWNITLPMISPVLFFNLVLGIIGALQAFTNAFVATDGGPAYATWFFALHIYQHAFSFSEMGYASALALVFFIILVAFTYVNFKMSVHWVYYAGEVK